MPFMRQRENLLDVVGLLYRRRRFILALTGVACAISILVALLLPVYYKASTTFLAASPDLTNPSKLFGTGEVDVYGTGDDLERLLAVSRSEEVVGFLIDSFDLYEVYDIDPASTRARNDVREALDDVYAVERNRYDAISLEVEDEEPERAAAMANAARDRVSVVIRNVNGGGQRDLADMYRSNIATKEARLKIVGDSLRAAGLRYGIVDVTEQSAGFSVSLTNLERAVTGAKARLSAYEKASFRGKADTLAVLKAQLLGDEASQELLRGEFSKFAAGRGAVEAYNAELEVLNEQLALNRESLSQITSMEQQSGPIMYVLDVAAVPDRKSRPIRWLIVLGSTLAAFVFAVLGVVVFDSYKDTEWQRYLHS